MLLEWLDQRPGHTEENELQEYVDAVPASKQETAGETQAAKPPSTPAATWADYHPHLAVPQPLEDDFPQRSRSEYELLYTGLLDGKLRFANATEPMLGWQKLVNTGCQKSSQSHLLPPHTLL
jgi:hypothetical protein